MLEKSSRVHTEKSNEPSTGWMECWENDKNLCVVPCSAFTVVGPPFKLPIAHPPDKKEHSFLCAIPGKQNAMARCTVRTVVWSSFSFAERVQLSLWKYFVDERCDGRDFISSQHTKASKQRKLPRSSSLAAIYYKPPPELNIYGELPNANRCGVPPALFSSSLL